jgi:hypothetical protein
MDRVMRTEIHTAGGPQAAPARHEESSARRDAERRLDGYFRGFGVSEPEQLERLVGDVLARLPVRRVDDDVDAAALEAAEARVAAWFARVLGRGDDGDADGGDSAAVLLAGRAAFLLCDGPARWSDAFLRDPPPPALVAAMRRAAVEPVPPPEPAAMPSQDLAFWSLADLLPPRLPKPTHAAVGLLVGLVHWR